MRHQCPWCGGGALEAPHDAVQAFLFFLLGAHLESEARVWWVFNHRAFLEAMCTANILRDHESEVAGARDRPFVRAMADIGEHVLLHPGVCLRANLFNDG